MADSAVRVFVVQKIYNYLVQQKVEGLRRLDENNLMVGTQLEGEITEFLNEAMQEGSKWSLCIYEDALKLTIK